MSVAGSWLGLGCDDVVGADMMFVVMIGRIYLSWPIFDRSGGGRWYGGGNRFGGNDI